jgi:hypothetical protein
MTRASLFREASALGATLVLAAAALACSEGSDDGATTSTGGSEEEEGTGGTTPGTGGSETAGSTSTGGTAPSATPRWTFDTGREGWNIEWIDGFPEGGAGGATGDVATVTWDGDEGDPEPGSLLLEAQYSAAEQKVQVEVDLEPAEDLTDRIITAQIRLDSGLNGSEEDPGGAMLFVKTGDAWVWADGGWRNLTSGTGWAELSMEVSAPASYGEEAAEPFDPTRVRQIGVHVATGSDAKAPWKPAVVHIDTISY